MSIERLLTKTEVRVLWQESGFGCMILEKLGTALMCTYCTNQLCTNCTSKIDFDDVEDLSSGNH